jgi:tetratricopeptide (TPR) repeat protein
VRAAHSAFCLLILTPAALPRLSGVSVAVRYPAYQAEAVSQERAAPARETYARAVDLEAKGNHPAALALLWEAAGLAPRDADIQNRLGEALDRVGALDAAIEAFRQALAARPDFRKADHNLILTLVKAGRGPEAVARARARVTEAPDDPDAHFTLGLAQSEQDVADAIQSFRRTMELEPRHVLARYNLALVLKRVDRMAEAIEELNAAIAIEPRAESHYTLGVIYWHQGDADRASRALRAAVAAEPRYADAHYTLGVVLAAQRDWTRAAESLRRAIELRQDLWSAHYTLGRVLRQSGDHAAAREQLAAAEKLRRRAQLEHEASVATSVGTQRLEGGDLTGALDQFRRATAIFEPYAPAHYQMGRVLRRLGEHNAARAAFHRAQQLNPSLVPPH